MKRAVGAIIVRSVRVGYRGVAGLGEAWESEGEEHLAGGRDGGVDAHGPPQRGGVGLILQVDYFWDNRARVLFKSLVHSKEGTVS